MDMFSLAKTELFLMLAVEEMRKPAHRLQRLCFRFANLSNDKERT